MPLIKGTVNVQVKVPSIQSEQANDDDKVILVDAETGDTTVISKTDFLHPLNPKESVDDDDSFIGIQPDGSLFRITKSNLLTGLAAGGSGEFIIPLDPTFPRFIFENQSKTTFVVNYPIHLFEPQKNSDFDIDYPAYKFDNQSKIDFNPYYPVYQFDNQNKIDLKPNYPIYQFEEQKR